MHIEIAERLKPFSHLPGTLFILPGTNYRVQVFPACIKIDNLSGVTPENLVELKMAVKGPLDQFTVQQDLEKGEVLVWGKSPSGFIRYSLKGCEVDNGITLHIEKAPIEGISFQLSGVWSSEKLNPLQAGDIRVLTANPQLGVRSQPYQIPLIDRLSLGNHKSQDWALMRRRCDFAEIFPIWHRLGQLVPKQNEDHESCSIDNVYFKEIQQAFPEHILSYFKDMYLAGFESGLSPRLFDADYQGIMANEAELVQGSLLQLLSEGAKLIRSLFVQCHENSISLLPSCPPDFHCGRFINVTCENVGVVSLEWTKKRVRRVELIATSSGVIRILSRDGQKRCRVRRSSKERGVVYELDSPFEVVKDQIYWFDNFEN